MSPKSLKKHRPDPLPEDPDALARLPVVLNAFPVSENTWWKGIRAGIYPKPVRLGKRIRAWRVSDVRKLIESLNE